MSDEKTAAQAVIQEYVAACAAGSGDRLKAIFHENALMSGYLMGNYMTGSPQPFFDAVENPPPDIPAGAEYQAEIVNVEVSGSVASVTLKEMGFMGLNFTDYFHLVKVDETWKIISKTFEGSQP